MNSFFCIELRDIRLFSHFFKCNSFVWLSVTKLTMSLYQLFFTAMNLSFYSVYTYNKRVSNATGWNNSKNYWHARNIRRGSIQGSSHMWNSQSKITLITSNSTDGHLKSWILDIQAGGSWKCHNMWQELSILYIICYKMLLWHYTWIKISNQKNYNFTIYLYDVTILFTIRKWLFNSNEISKLSFLLGCLGG